MRKTMLCLALVAPLVCTPSFAAINTFVANLYGANEVGPGDPDGYGVATVSIDTVGLTVSWAILALGVDMPLTGSHIHAAPAGVNGPVIVDFSGTLAGSGLSDPDLASITPGNAPNFYVNIHNSSYPAGAIRGQLQFVGTTLPVPEPGTYAMMLAGLGVLGFLAKRRG